MSETRWEPIDDGAGLAVKGQGELIGPEFGMRMRRHEALRWVTGRCARTGAGAAGPEEDQSR